MNTHLTWSKVGRKWDPVLGMGQVVHGLVQHISTEGGCEEEGNLSFKFYSIKVCNICYLASIFTARLIAERSPCHKVLNECRP